MSIDILGEAWKARRSESQLEPKPAFRDDSLVLGAGTVIAKAEPRLIESDAARLKVLLTAAYGRTIGRSTLAHVERALLRRSERQFHLAEMHLALSGLGRLDDPEDASRRLFLADGLMEAGASAELVLKALDPERSGDLRRYDPDQPRVPAGSGRESGQWTAGPGAGDGPTSPTQSVPRPGASAGKPKTRPSRASVQNAPHPARPATATGAAAPGKPARAARVAPRSAAQERRPAFLPPPVNPPVVAPRPAVPPELPPLFEPDLLPALARGLLTIVRGASGPAVFLGVLLIPSKIGLGARVVAIPGYPGLRVGHGSGESEWVVSLNGVALRVLHQNGALLMTEQGQFAGAVLADGSIAIDLHIAAPEVLKSEEPRLCPIPSKDKPGQGSDSRSRDYENQMKHIINPEQPTPDGFGMALLNPITGKWVIFDDCHLKTGIMLEYKDRYERLITNVKGVETSVTNQFSDQSLRDVQAAKGRPVIWVFSEEGAAMFAKKLFETEREGREHIWIVVYPYLGRLK